MAELFGHQRAREVVDGRRRYNWIYQQVLDRGSQIDEALAASEIVLPPRSLQPP